MPARIDPDKTLLNFIPRIGGGGLQNALSFLQVLDADPQRRQQCTVLTQTGSKVHELCLQRELSVIEAAPGLVGRLLFELRSRRRFARSQLCFTFWGGAMLGALGHLVNVGGCAASNLLYPEIDFWGFLPPAKRRAKMLKDLYRRRMIERNDFWIFETQIMADRAVRLAGFPADRVAVVRMAASNLVSPEKILPDLADGFESRLPSGFRFLFLCGAHPNKRQHLLPGIARGIRESGVTDFCFVTTMGEADPYAQNVLRQFGESGLGDHISNIGPVPSDHVATLIDRCDAMCSLSLLESFSNNYVESWRMQKPLVLTDADWARHSCGDGAIYVRPGDGASAGAALAELAANASLRSDLVAAGNGQLATYPTAAEKNENYFRVLATAAGKGICPRELRREIHWPKIASGGAGMD